MPWLLDANGRGPARRVRRFGNTIQGVRLKPLDPWVKRSGNVIVVSSSRDNGQHPRYNPL